MNKIEIVRSLSSAMKGNISMKNSHIEKCHIGLSKKYKTETINQARDYGKLE